MGIVNTSKLLLVFAIGVVVGVFAYKPFAHSSWSTLAGFASICAAYTIFAFGLAWSIEDGFIDAEGDKPIWTIVLVHCLFLGFVTGVVRFALYIGPFLPNWLTMPSGTSRRGGGTVSASGILEFGVLLVAVILESVWLLRNVRRRRFLVRR